MLSCHTLQAPELLFPARPELLCPASTITFPRCRLLLLPAVQVLYAAPRARSSVTRLQFEWVLELAAVKAMIAQFRWAWDCYVIQ
jgi:hypothetical protein